MQSVKKFLTYKNTSIDFVLRKHKNNQWWKRKNSITWEYRLKELESQLWDCLLKTKAGKFYVKPGALPMLSQSFTVSIDNQVKYPDIRPFPWKKKPEFDLYPYQEESVRKLIDIKHGNISLPTGAGKSLTLLTLTRQLGLEAVIVTPSKSIFNELLKEFKEKLGPSLVGAYGDGKKDLKRKVTIAIGKSLTMLKEGTDAYEFFANKKAMLVDESHCFASDQLEKVCHGVLKNVPYRSFVSATQTRGDGTEKLLMSIIGKNVVDMSIENAIRDGYLCPLKFFIMTTTSPSQIKKDDPLEIKREHFLYNTNIAKNIAKIANASAKHKNESTLILVEELRQIKIIKDLLAVPYAYVHSSSQKDAQEWDLDKVDLQTSVDAFNSGDVKVLIGTRAISTGTNMYPTHNTVNWVGGSSEIVTKQGSIGRSTRKLEISKYAKKHPPKPFSKIFDFKVENHSVLENHLKKRISFYKESGADIKFL